MGVYYLVHASGYQRKNHKYIRRTGSPGHYSYVYEDGSTSSNNASASDEYKRELAANSGKNVSVNYSNNTPRTNVSDEYLRELAANSGKNVSVNYSNNTPPRTNVSDEYKQELASNSRGNHTITTNQKITIKPKGNVSTNYSSNESIGDVIRSLKESAKQAAQQGNNYAFIDNIKTLKEKPEMYNLKSIATNELVDPKIRKEAAKLRVQQNAGKKIRVSDVTKSFSKAIATSDISGSNLRKRAAKLNVSENKPQKIIDKLKNKLIKFL